MSRAGRPLPVAAGPVLRPLHSRFPTAIGTPRSSFRSAAQSRRPAHPQDHPPANPARPTLPPSSIQMAPTKKSKSAKSTESIAARLALVVKSGKYSLGYKSALKQMRNSKGASRLTRLHPPGTGA